MAGRLFDIKLEVPRSFAELGPEVRQDLGAMVENATINIRDLAQDAAPVLTGNLKSGITADTDRAYTDLYGEANSAADYSLYVEAGTHNTAAQPFFEPAVEAVRGPFIRSCENRLTQRIGGR